MKVRQAALVGAASLVFAVAAYGQSREHVVCYAAKPSKKVCTNPADAGKLCEDDLGCSSVVDACASPGKFPKGVTARLNDDTGLTTVGESKTFDVKKPTKVCIPVDKNNEGVTDTSVSWLTYPLKQTGSVCSAGANIDLPCGDVSECPSGACVEQIGFDGSLAKNHNLLVEDQYTNIRLNAAKVDFLMVPATRCDGNNDATCVVAPNAAPAADTQEHYKCYKAKPTKSVCAAGQTNAFAECEDDLGCMPGGADTCVALAKFTKNQSAYASDANNFITGERAFGIGKLTHVCKAVEKTFPPGLGGTPEGSVNPKARMLCYKSKGAKGRCNDPNDPTFNFACKKDEDCGGISDVGLVECAAQNKFDKEDTDVLGLYVNDQFDLVPGSGPTVAGDYHRENLAKEDLVCMPACEGDVGFTQHVLRATHLEIPSTGNLGDGQNVDNLGTCQPNGMCSAGIDNVLGIISGTIPDLNMALDDAVMNGDINIILELNDLANGAQVVNGYTGNLDTPAGCTNVNDPNQVCNFQVSDAFFDTSTCAASSDIAFPVTVTNLPGTASIVGGGPGSNLSFSLPFGDVPVELTARSVKVSASIVNTGGTAVVSATGALGGAINQRELKNTIDDLPEGICDMGPNDGDSCTPMTETADCTAGFTCDTMYLGGFDKASLKAAIEILLIRDLNMDGMKTCEGGDGEFDNAGEPCTMDSDCPVENVQSPPACDDNDSHSVGIKFTGINAAITSNDPAPCTKATCSLY